MTDARYPPMRLVSPSRHAANTTFPSPPSDLSSRFIADCWSSLSELDTKPPLTQTGGVLDPSGAFSDPPTPEFSPGHMTSLGSVVLTPEARRYESVASVASVYRGGDAWKYGDGERLKVEKGNSDYFGSSEEHRGNISEYRGHTMEYHENTADHRRNVAEFCGNTAEGSASGNPFGFFDSCDISANAGSSRFMPSGEPDQHYYCEQSMNVDFTPICADLSSTRTQGFPKRPEALYVKTEGLYKKSEALPSKAVGLSTKIERPCAKGVGLSPKVEGLSAKFEGSSAKADGLSTKIVRPSAKAVGLSSKFEGLSGKSEGLSTKSEVLSAKAEGLSTKAEEQPMKPGEALPSKPCLVCGDVASGLHYGAASCEACKAFFKRTVQGNISYTCLAGGECVMNKRGRKACQSCRYEKCVRIGMLKEGIRSDRQRGGQHKRQADPVISGPTSEELDEAGGGAFVDQSALDVQCRENAERLLSCLLKIEPQKLYARPSTSLPDGDNKLTAALLDLADKELVAMIGWAKQIPGFPSLSVTTQASLLHYAWLDLFCLSVAYRSAPYAGVLAFADDLRVAGGAGGALGASLPSDLDADMRRLARKLSDLGVTKEEFVLLKAMIVVHADVNVDPDACTALQPLRDSLYDALLCHELRRAPCAHRRRVGHVLLVLPLVVSARRRVASYWRALRDGGRVIPQRLLREMIDAACH